MTVCVCVCVCVQDEKGVEQKGAADGCCCSSAEVGEVSVWMIKVLVMKEETLFDLLNNLYCIACVCVGTG